MSLSQHEVRSLLAACAAYDNRKLTEAAVLAWSQAATEARWTYDEAQRAVARHYAESTDMAKPGHITTLIRHQRTRPPRLRGLPAKSAASEQHREAVVSQLYQRMGWVRGQSSPDD